MNYYSTLKTYTCFFFKSEHFWWSLGGMLGFWIPVSISWTIHSIFLYSVPNNSNVLVFGCLFVVLSLLILTNSILFLWMIANFDCQTTHVKILRLWVTTSLAPIRSCPGSPCAVATLGSRTAVWLPALCPGNRCFPICFLASSSFLLTLLLIYLLSVFNLGGKGLGDICFLITWRCIKMCTAHNWSRV